MAEDHAKASPQQELAADEVAADTTEKLDGDSDGYDDAPFGDLQLRAEMFESQARQLRARSDTDNGT